MPSHENDPQHRNSTNLSRPSTRSSEKNQKIVQSVDDRCNDHLSVMRGDEYCDNCVPPPSSSNMLLCNSPISSPSRRPRTDQNEEEEHFTVVANRRRTTHGSTIIWGRIKTLVLLTVRVVTSCSSLLFTHWQLTQRTFNQSTSIKSNNRNPNLNTKYQLMRLAMPDLISPSLHLPLVLQQKMWTKNKLLEMWSSMEKITCR